MAYKDKNRQREYCRQWVAKRRAAWFENKYCVQCGSTERLELDHVDPSTKIDHSVWSWSEERRLAELEKCQPLCHKCHKEKSSEYSSVFNTGVPKPTLRKLTNEQVVEARARHAAGEGIRKLEREYNMAHSPMWEMLKGITYANPVSA